MKKIFFASCLFFVSFSQVFAVPEGKFLQVSPKEEGEFLFKPDQVIEDYAVSNTGSEVLTLATVSGKSKLMQFSRSGPKLKLDRELDFKEPTLAVVSHPEKENIWFLLSAKDKGKGPWTIWKLEKDSKGKLLEKSIFQSKTQLRRLVVSARPFYKADSDQRTLFYRLIFAAKSVSGIWQMQSIREEGDDAFFVSLLNAVPPGYVCPAGMSKEDQEEGFGCKSRSSYISEPKGALPLSFHSNGMSMSYEVVGGCGKLASSNESWNVSQKAPCSTPSFFHPNGSITWSWSKGKAGLKVETYPVAKKPETFFSQHTFIMPPVFLPDGRSVLGLEKVDQTLAFKLIPLDDPYAAIFNLWRFDLKEGLLNRVAKSGGALTNVKTIAQYNNGRYFHDVYDAIVYRPTFSDNVRHMPMIVLTDPFWYTASIAIETGFTYMELKAAIPGYRSFLQAAAAELGAKKRPTDHEKNWLAVLKTAQRLLDYDEKKHELVGDLAACRKGEGIIDSKDLKKKFNFAECKPRSHYTLNPELSHYWQSFKYLTSGTSFSDTDGVFSASLLSTFPDFSPKTLLSAREWIEHYTQWIAPTTYGGLLEKDPSKRWLSKHPFRKSDLNGTFSYSTLSLFPLGWGWDDELMSKLLDARPVVNPELAEWLTVFTGSSEIEEVFVKTRKELPWKEMMAASQNYFQTGKDKSFYGTYLEAIHTDAVSYAPRGIFQAIDQKFLKVRSLASATGGWVHLKHTLQLVSEIPSAAEGGQGGPSSFEIVEPEVPPAAVEPKPEVFRAQKKTLDLAIQMVRPYLTGDHLSIVTEMSNVSSKLEVFAQAAELQAAGKMLTPAMNQEAYEFGKFLDHADLFFNGVLSEGYNVARGKPDMQMGIIASVSRANDIMGYAATGLPFLTYLLIEEGGKKRIVLGSSFSVYEPKSQEMINDFEWRTKYLPATKLPSWLEEFADK